MIRIIQVGVSGYGRTWLETLARAKGQAGHVALVDVNPAAIDAARAMLCRMVNSVIDEAAGRLRVERGLPAFAEPGPEPEPAPPSSGDGTHRAVARGLAEDTLLFHSGGEIDDQSVQDLLVDLMHHAGPEAFEDALDAALERFEEEVEEDAEAAAEEGEPDPVRRAQFARLRDYQPARYDA